MSRGLCPLLGSLILWAVTAGCSRGGDDRNHGASAPHANSEALRTGSSARWGPASLSGTVLWLDAARGVERTGDRVTRWLDQSSRRNHASPDGERSSPTFVDVALNGRPALLFDGKSQYLRVPDSASLQFGAGDFVMAVALSHTTPTDTAWGYGCVVSKQEITYPFVGPSLWGNSERRRGQLMGQLVYHEQHVLTGAQNLNHGAPLVVLLHRRTDAEGTNLVLRVNRVVSQSTLRPGIDLSALGAPLHIGGTPDPRQSLLGSIAEIVAIKGAVATADAQALETYLIDKYGI